MFSYYEGIIVDYWTSVFGQADVNTTSICCQPARALLATLYYVNTCPKVAVLTFQVMNWSQQVVHFSIANALSVNYCTILFFPAKRIQFTSSEHA